MLHDPYFAAVMETARVERLRAGFPRRRRQNKTATSASRPAATAPVSTVVDVEERPVPAATAAR